jgi:hypothetical protein
MIAAAANDNEAQAADGYDEYGDRPVAGHDYLPGKTGLYIVVNYFQQNYRYSYCSHTTSHHTDIGASFTVLLWAMRRFR